MKPAHVKINGTKFRIECGATTEVFIKDPNPYSSKGFLLYSQLNVRTVDLAIEMVKKQNCNECWHSHGFCACP